MLNQNKFQNYIITAADTDLTIEAYLKQVLHFSNRTIQKLTRAKGIFINKKGTFLKRPLKENDVLRVLILKDHDYGVTPENGNIEILYEDEDTIVLNKPPFQLVHPAGNTTNNTLANYLAYYFQSKNILATIRPIHRLDRDTSGCIMFAKSAYAQTQLDDQLKARMLKRNYSALVRGHIEPRDGTIEQPIGKHPTKANQRAINANADTAITHYQTITTYSPTCTMVALNLDTGRTHQIRVHLAYLGYPIIGDKMYGTRSSLIARQALHADSITFQHLKTGEMIKIVAPLPTDMEKLIAFYKS
ncbi:MAG: rluD 1 [Massilibacillus sp.]|jgi:23S rRNA pseudouridine1911/1915/1917 synthase|nr:rluD 1 [Massilibacillus sp.]